MAKRKTARRSARKRVGRVSYYCRRGTWHLYYRDGRRPVRRRVADNEADAARAAAVVNGQLAAAAPTPFSFTPLSVAELRRRFLDHHEHVLRSALATVRRYRSASLYLERFVADRRGPAAAHTVEADEFCRYLRAVRVAANGHPHAARRALKEKGIRYILEVSRSLYGFAAKKRHLPPYTDNPFAGLGGKRTRQGDAKRVFVFDEPNELAFLRAADAWGFPVQFTLAKTGLRPGELIHLLVEELDFDAGWLHVRNKPELGWQIKTGRERAVPLVAELVELLRRVVGGRTGGPVFLRRAFCVDRSELAGAGRRTLAAACAARIAKAEAGQALTREQAAKIFRHVWRDAGGLTANHVRASFIGTARRVGLTDVTCPKSWRHTFATLLQDANVDPLVRQITLGHAPAGMAGGGLGMTAIYTHTRPETQRREIERAVRLWPKTLELAARWPAALWADGASGDGALAGTAGRDVASP